MFSIKQALLSRSSSNVDFRIGYNNIKVHRVEYVFENSQEKFDIEGEAGKLTLYVPHETVRSYNQINMVWPV